MRSYRCLFSCSRKHLQNLYGSFTTSFQIVVLKSRAFRNSYSTHRPPRLSLKLPSQFSVFSAYASRCLRSFLPLSRPETGLFWSMLCSFSRTTKQGLRCCREVHGIKPKASVVRCFFSFGENRSTLFEDIKTIILYENIISTSSNIFTALVIQNKTQHRTSSFLSWICTPNHR